MQHLALVLTLLGSPPGQSPANASVEPVVVPPAGDVEEDIPPTTSEGGAAAQLATMYEEAPVSQVSFPSDRQASTPLLSVGQGRFCFLDDSKCRASLLMSGDVGAGLNVLTHDEGISELPFTQYRVGGGFVLRPLYLSSKRWHPWGLGLVGNWSRGSGYPQRGAIPEEGDEDRARGHTDSARVAVLNQLWLKNRENAFHLDLTLGAVYSTVLDAPDRYWGSHLELAFGFGGWGALFIGSDFLDRDIRMVLGFRVHAIAAGPIAGLAALGHVAGGNP